MDNTYGSKDVCRFFRVIVNELFDNLCFYEAYTVQSIYTVNVSV